MNVGLCWQGSRTHRNDAVRSIPHTDLLPLAEVEGVTWHCMAPTEWQPWMADHGWVNAFAGGDWLDSAKVVAQSVDLVISVDTALVHLCGGLGVPVWVLLAAMPDMRWGLEGERTPWYRSARLYRQQVVGDWRPVLERVASDLQQEVYGRRFREAA